MKIQQFELERYFAKYEFSAPYLLSCSDCEPLTLKELLNFADSETLKLWENLWLGYTESQGHPELRNEVSNLYETIAVDNSIVLAPEEGIFIAMNILLETGDDVIVTYPGYQSLYQIANSIGCNIKRWTPITDNGFRFDIEDLKKLIDKNTKLIVVNFPHNPTGTTISKNELAEIIALARENDIYIFSDEMYKWLEYSDDKRLDSVCDVYEKGISLSGVSKSFALPGLRIGWLCTRDSLLMQKIIEFKDYTTICNSAPSEILALMALRAKEEILFRNLDIIKNNIQIFNTFFKTYKEIFNWTVPEAGPIAFPELKLDMKIQDFADKLISEKGIMILPAPVYHYERNNFRLGLGRKNTDLILKHLIDFLDKGLYK